ncbi:MAG: glycosyltransferase family 2 protein [Zoogloea sp.]|nr:glycosyltransferase family 2 protein [Zoogloea sp.]
MNAAERFSVVIVNYNGGDMLVRCVDSVIGAGLAAGNVFVVDNGSRDDSLARLESRHPGCRIIRNGCNAGFARAVNAGLRGVHTEFALLLNNDAELDREALSVLADTFDTIGRAAMLGGRLLYADGRLQNAVAPFPRLLAELLPPALYRCVAPEHPPGRPQTAQPLLVESVIGALFAVRMQAVAEFGLLDEDFFFFLEETEWCHRAAAHGWQVWHVPAARAIHAQGATAKRFNALARIEYQRSKLTYFRKTRPALYWLALFLLALKAFANALGGCLGTVLTLGLATKLRQKTAVYVRILFWYLAGRPEGVGLPDKCPCREA